MVAHRSGIPRNQMNTYCLEDLIAEDNIVRAVDAFVDILDFQKLGFAHIQGKKTGAPAYHPGLMVRIYIYGYLNRIRSSRKLEKECERNIELQWLCNKLVPCYHSISTFRTYKETFKNAETGETLTIDHRKALKEVFRSLNRFLNGEGLFGKETVATDGTKMRAQNAKKKNYTEEKLDKKIALSDANIAQYLDDLDQLDKTETLSDEQIALKEWTKNKLEDTKTWKDKFQNFKKELAERQAIDPDVTQISTTDPDARSIVVNNSGHADVSYNVVTAVDDKNCLITHFFTDNIKDTTLLADSLIATKAELDNDFAADLHDTAGDIESKLNPKTTINGLADKGFHAATQIHECAENGIITYVAIPKLAFSGKDKEFTIHNFIYNEKNDTYTCPNDKTLTTNGVWYDKKNRRGIVVTRIKRYNTLPSTCATCPFAAKCLSKTAIKYRISRQLERAENQKAVQDNRNRMETVKGKEVYKRRQAIVEHPFGIIKRQWATDFTLLRGLEKVNAEFAIVFSCYNLRPAVSILGVKTLIEKLKAAKNNAGDSFSAFLQSVLSRFVFKPL